MCGCFGVFVFLFNDLLVCHTILKLILFFFIKLKKTVSNKHVVLVINVKTALARTSVRTGNHCLPANNLYIATTI